VQLMIAPPPPDDVISQRPCSVRYFQSPKNHFSVHISKVFHICVIYGVCNYGTLLKWILAEIWEEGVDWKKLLGIGASDVFIWTWKSKLDFQNTLELVD
jgi:hypothetical protein